MIKRSPAQEYFESLFTSGSGISFQNVPKSEYEKRTLSAEDVVGMSVCLDEEIAHYYYKALLSYIGGLVAISKQCYSWATVQLYYSTFYSLRSFLACNKVVFLRAGINRSILLYVEINEGKNYKRSPEQNDHKGTIKLQKLLYGSQDVLLSQNMTDGAESITAYEWMAKRREEVNYKDIEFRDPNPFDYWVEIVKMINNKGLSRTVKTMVEDQWRLCFQDEYGVLGIPTKRLLLTSQELVNSNVHLNSPGKFGYINDLLSFISLEDRDLFLLPFRK